MSCRQTQHVVLRCGVRFRHGSLFRHRASGCVNSSSATRALCGIGIAPYVATFLVNILNLPQSRFLFGEFGEVWTYLVSLEKASTNTPDQPGVCYHVNLKTLVQTRMGDMNGMIQIGDVVFGFPTRSIALHEINMLNAEELYFPARKPVNLKETQCMPLELICELA